MIGSLNHIKRFLALAGVILLTFTISPSLPAYPVLATGNCTDGESIKIESSPFIATAPEGSIISSVFVKAGSDSSEGGCFEFTSDGNNGCYQVEGIGTSTVTVTRIGEGPDCKEISHVEFISTDSSDTPTPTPTPTPETTPTPTPTPETPSPIPTPTPNPESTPTPTPTQTENPTPTPTPPSSGGSSSSTSESNPSQSTQESVLGASDISEEEKQGEVLGASTLADTSGDPLSLGTIFQLSGFLLGGFGAIYQTARKNRPFA